MSNGGTVHIIGDQNLTKSIPLIKSLKVTSTSKDRGRILGCGDVKFSFEVNKVSVTLHVSYVAFLNISVVISNLDAHIYLNNILVRGGFDKVVRFKPPNIRKIQMVPELTIRCQPHEQQKTHHIVNIKMLIPGKGAFGSHEP